MKCTSAPSWLTATGLRIPERSGRSLPQYVPDLLGERFLWWRIDAPWGTRNELRNTSQQSTHGSTRVVKLWHIHSMPSKIRWRTMIGSVKLDGYGHKFVFDDINDNTHLYNIVCWEMGDKRSDEALHRDIGCDYGGIREGLGCIMNISYSGWVWFLCVIIMVLWWRGKSISLRSEISYRIETNEINIEQTGSRNDKGLCCSLKKLLWIGNIIWFVECISLIIWWINGESNDNI